MDSKFLSTLLIFFLFFSSWTVLGFSQDLKELSSGGGGGGGAQPTECMKKLLPCQPYLHKPSTAPPTCCMPLKEMVSNEVECLCGVITNPGILKSFNITEQDALDLAKACGANADVSTCKHSSSPSPPTTPSAPVVTPPPAANSSTNSSGSSPAKKNAGHKMYNLERSSFILFFVASMFLALSP